MRRVLFLALSVAFGALAPLAWSQQLRQGQPEAEAQGAEAFIRWGRQHAIPIATTEPGKGFKDLQPIKKIVGNARVVALGESVHEAHEFNEFRHRMLEFLVAESGFQLLPWKQVLPRP